MNTTDPTTDPTTVPVTDPVADPNIDAKNGGRHHKSHKGGKTKKVNSALKSWVAFVKKISKEENISYPKAMKRASKRKSEWKRGGGGMEESEQEQINSPMSVGGTRRKRQYGGEPLTPSKIASETGSANIVGGSRRKRSDSRKRRSSRRR